MENRNPQNPNQPVQKQTFQGDIRHDHHYHFGPDARNAIDSVIKENDDLKAQVKRQQMQIGEQLQTIAFLRTLNQKTPESPANNDGDKEIEALRAQLSVAQQQLAAARQELSVAEEDVKNLVMWTKKLDWSTTEGRPPLSLRRLFGIEEETVPAESNDGTPGTFTLQTVDGEWHGPVVGRFDGQVHEFNYCQGEWHGLLKLTFPKGPRAGVETALYWMGKNLNKNIYLFADGSRAYQCADEEENGVSVTVRDKEQQAAVGFSLKNGYRVTLHNYKNEVQVEFYQDDEVRSTKWYQLKK